MPLTLLADILELLGSILIAVSVIRVHSEVIHEHRIDKEVIKSMKGEKRYAIVGVIFIIISFTLRIVSM